VANRRRNLDAQFSLEPAGERSRLSQVEDVRAVPTFLLDVPETIPQLGYGSHQYFRYYGKFPSVVGAAIIGRFARPGTSVLDCYAGSGTSLVEAQISGLQSFGVDINPLAVLASNVKTSYVDAGQIAGATDRLVNRAERVTSTWLPTGRPDGWLNKWFSPTSQEQLGRLRVALNSETDTVVSDFLTVAFLGIVRRCSNAFDGEVRPHVNQSKRPRIPFAAFRDKVADMLAGLEELDRMRPPGITSTTVIGDNRASESYAVASDASVGLVIAHPPYLNSFNYLQVFSLEFAWAEGLPRLWNDWTMADVREAEHKAWPATNSSLVDKYYLDIEATTKASTALLEEGGVFSIVIGDATIRGELEAVHERVIDRVEGLGLQLIELWYRTTHYGIGKYAYASRADYHGDATKKDAVLFFKSSATRSTHP
jgi:hypothetical protein